MQGHEGHSHAQPAEDRPITIHQAAFRNNYSRVKDLLGAGTDANVRDEDEATPLHWAAGNDDVKMLQLLVSHGAVIDARTKFAETPLHWACKLSSKDAARYLVENGADVNARNYEDLTPIMVAIVNASPDMIPVLVRELHADVNARDKHDNTALHWAASKSDADSTQRLLECGADVIAANESGDTALHNAAACNSFAVTQMLAFYGTPVTARNRKGETPRAVAAAKRYRSLAETLERIEKGLGSRATRSPTLFYLTIFLNVACVLLFRVYVHARAQNLYMAYATYICSALSLVWLVRCNRSDPGYLPVNEFDAEKGAPWGTSLCFTCKCRRPLRSKHCRQCNRCVGRFDHHCDFTNNCVGVKNLRIFMTYLILQYMTVFLGLVSLFAFTMSLPNCPPMWRLLSWTFFLFKNSKVAFLLILSLFPVEYIFTNFVIAHLSSVSANLTTNETKNNYRYAYFQDEMGLPLNPFDMGLKRNWLQSMNLEPPVFNYMSLFELPKRRTVPGAAAAGGGAAPMMGMFGMQQQPQQQAGGHVHSAACNHGPMPSAAAPVAGAGAAGVGTQLAMSRFGIGSSAVGAGGEHAHAHTSMGK